MPSPDKQSMTVVDTPKPQAKRQRRDDVTYTRSLLSLERAISPPPLRREPSPAVACLVPPTHILSGDIFADAYRRDKNTSEGTKDPISQPVFIDLTGEEPEVSDDSGHKSNLIEELDSPKLGQAKLLPSPFQLTSIRNLPATENIDTVGIKDILGDVMIKEAWIFNFLIDLDWVMDQFDPDIKNMVDVKIVHGSWRNEDSNRIRLEEQSKNFKNAKVICAYMPEPFGTHHTKMVVLFRHDKLAQIIIHTSNMIEFDWTDMTQAVWRSPLLPLISDQKNKSILMPQRIGKSFKDDLLEYFTMYGENRTGSLVEGLKRYSFDGIKAMFIASVPGRFHVDGRGAGEKWGWMGLKRIMGNISLHNDLRGQKEDSQGKIVVQVSSIATLGPTNTWLSPVLFKALSASRSTAQFSPPSAAKKPKISIIFPTAEEVRNFINGYSSGVAIHMKIKSKAQQKQLSYLRPFLCHWDSSLVQSSTQSSSSTVTTPHILSGRARAAPHIKTYIRFTDQECSKIEWAMLTSANLSTQAWGSSLGNSSGRLMGQGEGEVRICSYEAGVVVYPELFRDAEEDVEIVPVFKKDMPDTGDAKGGKVIGLRMPYDIPIRAYGENDLPWCTNMSYEELDWRGQSWGGN